MDFANCSELHLIDMLSAAFKDYNFCKSKTAELITDESVRRNFEYETINALQDYYADLCNRICRNRIKPILVELDKRYEVI